MFARFLDFLLSKVKVYQIAARWQIFCDSFVFLIVVDLIFKNKLFFFLTFVYRNLNRFSVTLP